MADTAATGTIKIAAGSSELAPFVYFDGVVTFGINNSIIQIELGANGISPEGTGTKTNVLITSHLRCSAAAALSLRDALDKALGMLKSANSAVGQSSQPSGSTSTP
jgi:hypothetical protein